MLHLPLLGFSTLNIVHQHQTATQPIKANVSMLSNYKAVATDTIDAPKYVIKESNNAACTCYNQHKYN